MRKLLIVFAALLITVSRTASADSTVHGLATNTTSPLPASSCVYVDQGSNTDTKLCSGWAAAFGAALNSLTISAGTGLSGGGDLTANRTLSLTTPVIVGNGGTGLATLAPNTIYKGNGASALAVSALTDDGSKVSTTEPIDLTTISLVTEIANASVTGTTVNKLAKLTGAPSTAVITAITDADGSVGIVIAGSGTTGTAQIAVSGQASCVFDGATTAGDYVTISGTIAGDCHGAGASRPSATQVIGRVLTTNGAGGTYAVELERNFAPTVPVAANPTATIGASAVNGSAPSWMRSDAAPPIGANAITNPLLAQGGPNSLKGNPTGSTANEQDVSMPSCPDTAGNHLNWVAGTGPTCGISSSGGAGTPVVFVGTTAGTANAQTIASPTPTGFVFTDGYVAVTKVGSGLTNTGAATLSVNGTTAKAVATQDGDGKLAALIGGELRDGDTLMLVAHTSCPAPISADCYTVTTTPGSPAPITASATLTSAQWNAGQPVVISTAAQTITLPVATSLSPKGGIPIITIGQSVSLAPNAADGINGGTINTPVTIPANTLTYVTTTGSSGTGAFSAPLGPVAGTNITITPNANGTTTITGPPAASTSTAGIAKLHNVPVSVGWVATVNPNNAVIAVINQASTISAIIGAVETLTGTAATVTVKKAASGTSCASGTALHSGTFDANGTAATNQTLTVTTSALAVGDRLCITTTGTTAWTAGTGIGTITVFLAPL